MPRFACLTVSSDVRFPQTSRLVNMQQNQTPPLLNQPRKPGDEPHAEVRSALNRPHGRPPYLHLDSDGASLRPPPRIVVDNASCFLSRERGYVYPTFGRCHCERLQFGQKSMRRSVVGTNAWKQYMQFAVISTLGRMPSALGRMLNLPRPPQPAHPPHPLPHTILFRKPSQVWFHGGNISN